MHDHGLGDGYIVPDAAHEAHVARRTGREDAAFDVRGLGGSGWGDVEEGVDLAEYLQGFRVA